MTKEQCKEKVLELKSILDKDFEKGLEEIMFVGEYEMNEAENNYTFPRAVFAALLLHYANSNDGFGSTPTKNITFKKLSKTCALLHDRY